jgi:hypothetical protein
VDREADVVGVTEDVENEVLLLDSELLELVEELVKELFDVLVTGKVDMLCVVGIKVDEEEDVSKKDDELETLVLIEVENKLKLDEVFDGATNILDDELVLSNVLVGILDDELVNILDEELNEELVGILEEKLDEELVSILDEELDSTFNVDTALEELLDMKF